MNKVWTKSGQFPEDGQAFHRLLRIWYRNVFLFTVLLVSLRWDVAPTHDRGIVLDRITAPDRFALIDWMAQAVVDKVGDELIAPQRTLDDEAQIAFVRDYMQHLDQLQRLENKIRQVYADPAVHDPLAESRPLRAERDQQRSELNTKQDVAEAILQEQVESELRKEGFALGGQVIPPVRFRFTDLPDILIVSRRDKIERIDQRELRTGLTVDAQASIEAAVDKRLDVSSLVEPIGGMATYPTMLPETTSINWLVGVIAHEWTHNYLLLSPVGLNYATDNASRTVNETTANIVEREIRERVLKRFYPDLLTAQDNSPQPSTQPLAAVASDVLSQDQNKFNFNKEMRETRLHTDDLLARGKIAEAEAYMEQRRALFVANGYGIRKLNQAYFAFHGAYNDVPGGSPTAGRDPIGPAVQDLRKRSATLGDFLRAIAQVRTLEDVLQSHP